MGKFFGARVKRKEDRRFLTGQAKYLADLDLPGTLHVAFVRSPFAHARILAIASEEARRLPGVAAVFTAEDLGSFLKPLPIVAKHPAVQPCFQYPLGVGKARYVGEPVAMVLAEDRYVAEDGAELVFVEYDPLPTVTEPERALAGDAPLLHEALGSNAAAHFTVEVGDVNRAFQEADVTLSVRFTIQRQVGTPLEGRGILAAYDPGRSLLTVWASTQWPHTLQRLLSLLLNLATHQVHVIAPDVGGGFGTKQEFYPEEASTCIATVLLGRPAKWVEDRREHFLGATHSRQQIHDVEVAATQDGRLLGIRDRILVDIGAYVERTTGMTAPGVTASMLPGPYKLPNYYADVTCVVTNKVPMSVYRGAGLPEATFVMDRVVDLVSRRLNLDPAEVRFRNLIQPHEFPYHVGTTQPQGFAIVYDSGNYPACLHRALELVDYPRLREEQARWRKDGRFIGIGLSCYVENTGLGPYEGAIVRIDPSGGVLLVTGASPHGQGAETTLAQICADELGIEVEAVRVVHGDTAQIPFGIGTYASRTAVVAGSAAKIAAQAVREKAIRLASHLLEANPEDLEVADGRIYIKGTPARGLTLGELAAAAGPGKSLPPGMEPELAATRYFQAPQMTFSNAAHIAVAEVDVETGLVKILRYVVVHDSGRLINPMIVEGQIHGGVAQGIGGALLEEVHYDEDGQLLGGTLMDYLIPTTLDVPEIEVEHLETPSPLNPLGAKGAGEGGAISPPAAIANAVEDALRPFGVTVTAIPLTPDRIRRLIAGRGIEIT